MEVHIKDYKKFKKLSKKFMEIVIFNIQKHSRVYLYNKEIKGILKNPKILF
jgi:hypothetical protein